MMGRKRFTTEQIIHKLRQAEVEIAKGKLVPEACKQIGVTEQTFNRRSKCLECVEGRFSLAQGRLMRCSESLQCDPCQHHTLFALR
jgi:hypothetical protein